MQTRLPDPEVEWTQSPADVWDAGMTLEQRKTALMAAYAVGQKGGNIYPDYQTLLDTPLGNLSAAQQIAINTGTVAGGQYQATHGLTSSADLSKYFLTAILGIGAIILLKR